MASFKKALTRFFLLLIIVLACVGLSICGGVPAPFARRKENPPQFKIELVEMRDNEVDLTKSDFLNKQPGA